MNPSAFVRGRLSEMNPTPEAFLATLDENLIAAGNSRLETDRSINIMST
jgi:hypothetical protein